MSTLISLLHPLTRPKVLEIPVTPAERTAEAAVAAPPIRKNFAEEQIELLVRQVFFPGASKAARHVIVSAVDESTYIAELCMDMAKALADQVPGSVCVIEGNKRNPELETVFGNKQERIAPVEGFGFLRSRSQCVGGGLYLAPQELLFGATRNGKSPSWLERRLSDFRLEFDYTIVHASATARYADAPLLGRLSDGVVLVLEANATRRIAAQKAKERLQGSNARLLGTVLSERRFPIPEEIYCRL